MTTNWSMIMRFLKHDPKAQQEFIQNYEPYIKNVLRCRGCKHVDDVCQNILKKLWEHLQNTPEDLLPETRFRSVINRQITQRHLDNERYNNLRIQSGELQQNEEDNDKLQYVIDQAVEDLVTIRIFLQEELTDSLLQSFQKAATSKEYAIVEALFFKDSILEESDWSKLQKELGFTNDASFTISTNAGIKKLGKVIHDHFQNLESPTP